MRWLISVAVVSTSLTMAQSQEQPDHEQLFDKLLNLGIRLGFDSRSDPGQVEAIPRLAILPSKDFDPNQVIDLLGQVKNLGKLAVDLKDGELADRHVKIINAFPKIKAIEISRFELSAKEMATIAKFQHMEQLELTSRTFSSDQLKPLQEMKGLKKLHLTCAKFSPTELAQLKKTLPQVKEIDMIRIPAVVMTAPMKAAANDDAVTKLRKEKYNAALNGLQSYYELIMAGGATHRDEPPTFGSGPFVELATNLKDCALEMNEPAMKLQIIGDYVDLLEIAESENLVRMKVGTMAPYKYHRTHYYYLDAQLLKMQLEKQLEKK